MQVDCLKKKVAAENPAKQTSRQGKWLRAKTLKCDGSGQAQWETVPTINMYTPNNIASRYRSNRREGSRHILNLCLESSLLLTP